ncbi:hypothetical protein [Actinomadura mexicana]|nr:hypothetical protein [Actinomadura mexicana]
MADDGEWDRRSLLRGVRRDERGRLLALVLPACHRRDVHSHG